MSITTTYTKRDGVVYVRTVDTRTDVRGATVTLADVERPINADAHIPQLQKKAADYQLEIDGLQDDLDSINAQITALQAARDS